MEIKNVKNLNTEITSNLTIVNDKAKISPKEEKISKEVQKFKEDK